MHPAKSKYYIFIVKAIAQSYKPPLALTRHVFVKHGCPRWQQSQNMAKSLNFDPVPSPGACDISEVWATL